MFYKPPPQPASPRYASGISSRQENGPLSPGQYLSIFLLMCVPILNIILLFVWSFGSRANLNKKNFARASLILLACAAVLLPLTILFFGELYLPTPTNEQIIRAVAASNEAEAEPLELVYEEMLVPHRYPGRASAVLLVPDGSVQRNFSIDYDKKTKTFYVSSYITLASGEDGWTYQKE